MKQHTITTYDFEELTDKAKENAVNELFDINVDHDWWEFTYDDAGTAGLKITGFDLGRGSYVDADFIDTAEHAAKAIIANHGETTETHKTAQGYMIELARLQRYSALDDEDICYEAGDELEDIGKEFLKSLCEDYRIILQHEYDYLTSEEAIIETIKANEYDFTDDGKLY